MARAASRASCPFCLCRGHGTVTASPGSLATSLDGPPPSRPPSKEPCWTCWVAGFCSEKVWALEIPTHHTCYLHPPGRVHGEHGGGALSACTAPITTLSQLTPCLETEGAGRPGRNTIAEPLSSSIHGQSCVWYFKMGSPAGLGFESRLSRLQSQCAGVQVCTAGSWLLAPLPRPSLSRLLSLYPLSHLISSALSPF